jgi:5-methylcytosine-specific restriction endonuclease McrA
MVVHQLKNIALKTANAVKVKRSKQKIPRALREQVWIQNIGQQFEHKCLVNWCKNKITAFDFHVGHNIPESKGGKTSIENLKPICARCNLSMGSKYTISEWSKLDQNLKQEPLLGGNKFPEKPPWWICC